MTGTLYVVGTPIGNLEDLTFRALRVLREVDLIACEDTRRTSRLLAHYEISRSLVSLHEHNERQVAPRLVDQLRAGSSIALVSDAGTPGISDPGTLLVRLAREAGVKVTPVPGPSAITAALSVSGIPATPFTFLGFPPSSGRARAEWFAELRETPGTVVFFEAPHRIERTLKDLQDEADRSVIRPIVVHREISKIHETSVEWPNKPTSGRDEDVMSKLPERGEFVVVVGPAPPTHPHGLDASVVVRMYDQIETSGALEPDQIDQALAAIHGVRPARIRRIVKETRIAARRRARVEPDPPVP